MKSAKLLDLKMVIYKRVLSLPNILKNKSFFLFGPRATGKSFLIERQLKDVALIINLLKSEVLLRLLTHPSELEEIIRASQKKIVVIDEIQLAPILLNEVHRLIEENGITFLLTGSSTRKLKKSHSINLLAGRAWEAHLFPLTRYEITNFDLNQYLQYGGLPAVYNSDFPQEELYAYVETYLKLEIQSEALVRKIPAFARFLQVSALTSGQIVNFTTIARESSVPVTTVKEYYSILEDTLIGFWVPAWTKSVRRVATKASKFYYFDIGVKNILSGVKNLDSQTNLYGYAFEQFIMLEIRAYLDYRRFRRKIYYWRSKHGHEVDLIIDDDIAIEIKTTVHVTERHCKGLIYLSEENMIRRYLVISLDKTHRIFGNIENMYYEDFLEKLWSDHIIDGC